MSPSMPLPMFKPSGQTRAPAVRNVIAIAAGKGGVGKSTLTVNLGLALKRMNYSVGILDLDIYGPSIRKMMPEEQLPMQNGDRITPALCFGMPTISMAYFRRDNEASVVRAPIANGIVKQFIQNVDWGDLDYLLIDFPPGTGDIHITCSQSANIDGAVVITTPQEVAVMDVRKAMHMFEQVGIPIIGVVENMSYYVHEKTQEKIHLFGQGGGTNLARECGVPFLGEIPLDPMLCQHGDRGESLFAHADAIPKIAQSFLDIAANTIAYLDAFKGNSGEYLKDFEIAWKEIPSR